MSPLISVIVPVYQVAAYLNTCVASICGQTYRELEIILVDDGSTDKSPLICDEWKRKDSRVKVVHKINGGLSDARNAGMAVAAGDYIGFVDADDWISPEMYERLVFAIEMNNSDIACCAVEMFWESSDKKSFLLRPRNNVLNREEAQLALLKETELKQPVWYKLYKRKMIQDIPFEIGKQHEDVFWSYQAVGRASRVSIIDYVGYHYRQRADSIMGRRFSMKNLDALDAYCRRYEYLKMHFPKIAEEGLVCIWEACIFYGQMNLLYIDEKDRIVVWNRIQEVCVRYPIKISECRNVKPTHWCWLLLAQVSLRTVCIVKNKLKIGL